MLHSYKGRGEGEEGRGRGARTVVRSKERMKVPSYLKHRKRVRIMISEVTHIVCMWECDCEGRRVVGFSSLPTSCLAAPSEVISIVTNISSCSDPASSSFLSFYCGIHDWLHSWEKRIARHDSHQLQCAPINSRALSSTLVFSHELSCIKCTFQDICINRKIRHVVTYQN